MNYGFDMGGFSHIALAFSSVALLLFRVKLSKQ